MLGPRKSSYESQEGQQTIPLQIEIPGPHVMQQAPAWLPHGLVRAGQVRPPPALPAEFPAAPPVLHLSIPVKRRVDTKLTRERDDKEEVAIHLSHSCSTSESNL